MIYIPSHDVTKGGQIMADVIIIFPGVISEYVTFIHKKRKKLRTKRITTYTNKNMRFPVQVSKF